MVSRAARKWIAIIADAPPNGAYFHRYRLIVGRLFHGRHRSANPQDPPGGGRTAGRRDRRQGRPFAIALLEAPPAAGGGGGDRAPRGAVEPGENDRRGDGGRCHPPPPA